MIHTPERLPHETQADYRERQRASKAASRLIECGAAQERFKQHFNRAKRRGELPARDTGQRPKFAKPRGHKQHTHPLRDAHGALTLTGSRILFVDALPDSRHYELGGSAGPEGFTKVARRIWLGGIFLNEGLLT